MPVKPMTRQQELVKKLRAAAYVTREERVASVKRGNQPYDIFTVEELLELLPGRRIAWLGDLARHTTTPDQPLWTEMEEVVSATSKVVYDAERNTITVQTREWQTRTIRLDRVFEVTIRVIPAREVKKATTRSGRARARAGRVVL